MLRAELAVPELFRCPTQPLAEVAPKAMSWIWPGWIPRGCLSLVVGEPGVGKSLYSLQLAAMVTQGGSTIPNSGDTSLNLQRAWSSSEIDGAPNMDRSHSASGRTAPATEPAEAAPAVSVGTVVLFDAGDTASILRSRLDAAKADVARIVLVERNWRGNSPDDIEDFLQPQSSPSTSRPTPMDKDRDLRRDLESLELHIVQLRQAGHDVSLIIIDPIESLLRDALDKHRLARLLSDLADRLNVAIVAVGTTSSTPQAYPGLHLDRKGIDALFKMSRTVVSVVRDLEDGLQRMVLPTKLNLSAAPLGLSFSFCHDGSLEWTQSIAPVTGEGYVAQAREQRKKQRQREPSRELGRAMAWLKERLSEGGVPVTTVRSDANELDISRASLRRAYDELGCVSKKSRGSGHWVWRLPGSTEDAQELEGVDGKPVEGPDEVESRISTESASAACLAAAQ